MSTGCEYGESVCSVSMDCEYGVEERCGSLSIGERVLESEYGEGILGFDLSV